MPVSIVQLDKFITGTNFPANKNDLRKTARENCAPDLIIDLINNLPDRRFNSETDVNRAIYDIE
ncbi:MAG TPA: DUF2795 domain-containing protein [Deltaproteobacteria bacterium]|jgi:hypothetical protein|nr:DUF2795 domain-containing protein [Deltaproteobacteria bacterium]HQJ08349.1 DUF2795 domain-containing protein [Deltaproteobacteria bacterium]